MMRNFRTCRWVFLVAMGCWFAGPAGAQETAAGTTASPAAAPEAPVAPVTQPVAASAPARLGHSEVPLRSGFVISASLGLTFVIGTQGQAPTVPALAVPQGGLALGYLLNRVLLTLGAEFTNLTSTNSPGGGGTMMTQSSSTFLIVPGVQVAVLRSPDGRVEMLGAARFGFGEPVSTTSPPPTNPPPNTTTQFSFMYEVAPGVRYWPHRHFAVNLLAGFRGNYQYTSITSGNNMGTTSTGLNGIFATLGGMGVF